MWFCSGCRRMFSEKVQAQRHICSVGKKLTCRYCGSRISALEPSRRRHLRRESCRKSALDRGFTTRNEEDAFIEDYSSQDFQPSGDYAGSSSEPQSRTEDPSGPSFVTDIECQGNPSSSIATSDGFWTYPSHYGFIDHASRLPLPKICEFNGEGAPTHVVRDCPQIERLGIGP